MSASSLKHELADHIYQYLCHEAQYSDLPEAAKESLTAASECIEQAYKLNSSNTLATANNSNNTTNNNNQYNNISSSNTSSANNSIAPKGATKAPEILPDELFRIFTRHKEGLLSQQHTISQLPMTTRKKLSHLRAQIKRQASKAARSRLEKRSSVSGATSSSGDKSGNLSLGQSLDASTSKQQATDGSSSHHHHHYHHKDLHNQPNSTSSTESPNAISNNQAISSPSCVASNAGNLDANLNPNSSPNQQLNESGAGSSGTSSKQAASGHLSAPSSGHHRHKEFGVSVHQKNFKQKLIALLKKFRTDGSDFDSEEQYREALERELMKAAAGRGSRAIEELLEEDIDVEEESGGSELEDWDNISESSTPKPSLRPFFSSTTLDKI